MISEKISSFSAVFMSWSFYISTKVPVWSAAVIIVSFHNKLFFNSVLGICNIFRRDVWGSKTHSPNFYSLSGMDLGSFMSHDFFFFSEGMVLNPLGISGKCFVVWDQWFNSMYQWTFVIVSTFSDHCTVFVVEKWNFFSFFLHPLSPLYYKYTRVSRPLSAFIVVC